MDTETRSAEQIAGAFVWWATRTTIKPLEIQPIRIGRTLTQATGPPRTDAGVGIGVLRGISLLSAN